MSCEHLPLCGTEEEKGLVLSDLRVPCSMNLLSAYCVQQGSGITVANGGASLAQPAPSRARRLEAGERWARLAQARAASRPGLCAIAPGRRQVLIKSLTDVDLAADNR